MEKEVEKLISNQRNIRSGMRISTLSPDCIKLNKLCCIEDWQNEKLKKTISNFHQVSEYQYINRVYWEMTCNIGRRRTDGLIHRKDWEWSLG